MLNVSIIKCLSDNYSYLLKDETTNTVGIVDPSEFTAVDKEIQKKYSKLNIKDSTKVEDAMKGELKVLFDTIDAYFGKFGLEGVKQLPTTMGILTTLSNLQMLGRVTITSLGDIAQIFQNSVNWTSAIKGIGQTNLFKASWEKSLARNMNYDIVKYSREALQKGAGREADEIILNTAWMGKFGV